MPFLWALPKRVYCNTDGCTMMNRAQMMKPEEWNRRTPLACRG